MPNCSRRRIFLRGVLAVSLAAIAAFFMCVGPVTAQAQTGPDSADDPDGLARVQKIVDRIFRVADNRGAIVSPPVRLEDKSKLDAFANGRELVVTEGLLKRLTDDELAIVIGHELAHHILDHLQGPAREDEVKDAAKRLGFSNDLFLDATRQGLEAEADRYGLLYAVLAGYDIQQAPTVYAMFAEGTDHPPTAERIKAYKQRLQSIEDAVEIFNAGVDYALRGRFNYAKNAFQELVNTHFGTHDIYHNLGTIHHLIAFTHLAEKDFPPQVCSVSLELTSSLTPQGSPRRVATRGSGSTATSNKEQFLSEIKMAIEFYQQAVHAKPDYAPSLNNLGCAYLHLHRLDEDEGDLDQATGALKHAAKLEPSSAVVANNLAVAYLLQGRRENALTELKHSLQLNPQFTHAHFNLGTVLDTGNGPQVAGEARREFQSYLEDTDGIRTAPYVTRARERLGLTSEPINPGTGTSTPAGSGLPSSALPMLPGDSEKRIPSAAEPEQRVDVDHEHKIQSWRFSDWKILIRIDGDCTQTMPAASCSFSVEQVTVASDRYRTPEGIRVGSAVEEIRKAYGIPDGEQSRGDLKLLCYVHKGAPGFLFWLRDGKISSWSEFQSY